MTADNETDYKNETDCKQDPSQALVSAIITELQR
jgi:hypothetical protein